MKSTKPPVVFIHGLSDAVADLVEFADRGHSLTIDPGWPEVADACLAWLQKQDL